MKLSKPIWPLAVAALFAVLCNSAAAQTSAALRAKYGEPQMIQIKDNRLEAERYLVRPNISMTVRYTKQGQACEADLEPMPGSRPKLENDDNAPADDYMLTAEVIAVFNELAPIEQRGRKTGEGSMNGGDPKMVLHHPGCIGQYLTFYENVAFGSTSWCGGGTFSATIHFGQTSCKGQSFKMKKRKPLHESVPSGLSGRLNDDRFEAN